MKSVSVASVVRFTLIFGVMLVLVQVGFAEGESDGKLGEQLALGLYCDVTGLLEGDIGLLVGLVLIFSGLWSMINGTKLIVAAPLFVVGALITALPSLIMASFESLGQLLTETNISKTEEGKTGFTTPVCNTRDNYEGYDFDSQTGTFYPTNRENPQVKLPKLDPLNGFENPPKF